jgi:two-component system, OmpR family, sensor kinase
MLTISIRWRLQFWVGFLLVCVLGGFTFTVYELQRIHLLNQLDEELGQRVAEINRALRGNAPPHPLDHGPGGPPPGRGRGGPPLDPGRGGPSRDRGPGGPPPDRGPGGAGPDNGPFSSPRGLREPRPFDGGWDARLGFTERQLSSEATALVDAASAANYYGAVWSYGGTLLKRSTNAPADLRCPARYQADIRLLTQDRGPNREAFHFTELGDCILAGCPLTGYATAIHRFTGLLLAVGSVVLVLGLGGGWWLAGRAIRPIDQISATARRISAGNLSERVEVPEADNELGRLAGVLNTTFARLEAAFAQQRQFTADASHELRTPLAVLITEAQSTLARQRNADEYREAVEKCLVTAQEMRRLVESLLALARFDAGQDPIKCGKLDLSGVAAECVERIRPLADEARVHIQAELTPLECSGDREALAQVITNLLANAIIYSQPGGEVRISTSMLNDAVILTISDTGIGIVPEHLPRVFDRFYRADPSRSRADGHTGLGLAISEAIVEAHGGRVDVVSQVGVGSTFTVHLPGPAPPPPLPD